MRFLSALIILLALPAALSAADIAVTVYNSNLGVISETRTLEFEKGVGELAFTDVPSQIDRASVRFEVLGDGNVSILEQNYAFDLVNPAQMYAKYIDEKIELVDKEGKLYSGKLLSSSREAIILEEKSGQIKIVMLGNIAQVSFPSLPEGLITRPTLFWIYNSDREGSFETNVGYQTSGMNWSAEYVGVLDSDEKNLGLNGWASIHNQSGKTYKDATLKLVAGDIHRAQQRMRAGYGAKEAVMYEAATDVAGFEEKAFFEYHLYTLPRKATLADQENKQISLFEPAGSAVEKVFSYRPERNPEKVEVAIKFKNSKETGLGMPLPAGRVRLFKADDDGSMILLGEDLIDHTPKNEDVKLRVGYAFDIKGEDKILSKERITSAVEERVYEFTLTNRKDEPVTVEVEKKLHGNWEILESDMEYVQKDASTIVFEVSLDADAKLAVKYKVRFYHR